MKTFEIEVVRSYTTTIEVEVPDNLTASDVERIIHSPKILPKSYPSDNESPYREEYLYDEIWDIIAEKELEQMDVEMLTCKVKML